MNFQAVFSTYDNRLTKGKIYQGNIVYPPRGDLICSPGMKVVVFDDKKEWMTFNPAAFEPVPPAIFLCRKCNP